MRTGRGTALVAALFASTLASSAGAQIIRGSYRDNPLAFASLSIGWMGLGGIDDPASGASWDFGGAPQWRASLEMPVGTGAAFGVVGTTARVPLTYRGGFGATGCGACDADANVSQLLAAFRIGGPERGFHQVIDLDAGATIFSNFQSTSGAKLGGNPVTDWSFGIGYGFGYGFSDRAELMIVQEYGLIIHKRQSGSPNNTAQTGTTRVGLRLGLGRRGPHL